jgi:hypothetical protein
MAIFAQEGLGYEYLSAAEQEAYKAQLSAFTSVLSVVDGVRISKNVDIMKVMQTVLGDNPHINYFNKTQIQLEESVFSKKMILVNALPSSQAEKRNHEMDIVVTDILSSIRQVNRTDYSQLLKLYEMLQTAIKYDKDELNSMSRGVSMNPDSHNAYGALVKGLAVCDGFSSAFVLLANKLGFEAMTVIGASAYTTSAFTPHAWNILKFQDKYYHVDLTWDARKFEEFDDHSYAYFMLSDDDMGSDHNWDRKTTPPCLDSTMSYYHTRKLCVANVNELEEAVRVFSLYPKGAFRIKVSRAFNLPQNAGEFLAQTFANRIATSGQRLQFSYGWNENTRCFIGKIMNQ